MKWVTREKVKVDRVACPWLLRKFSPATCQPADAPPPCPAPPAPGQGGPPNLDGI
jgi:hypothetical protein